MNRRGFSFAELLTVVAIIAILAALVVGGTGGCQNYDRKTTGIYKCVKTYTVAAGESGTHKRVDLRPENREMVDTFTCDDNVWLKLYNSATLYAQFEAGKWYKIEAVGDRNEYWSMFPYITSVREVSDPTKTESK